MQGARRKDCLSVQLLCHGFQPEPSRVRPVPFAALVSLLTLSSACTDESRCWDDGSCSTAEMTVTNADASVPPVSTEMDAAVPEGSSASSAPSAESKSSEAQPSSSASSASDNTSLVQGSDSHGFVSDASTEVVSSTSAVPSDSTDPTSGPQTAGCSEDAECAGLLCVSGSCEVCDPSDHRGCEQSETGNRCRATEGGSACVACIPGDAVPVSQESCGLNTRGVTTLECVAGIWQTSGCSDPDTCVDDETQVGSTVCGPNGDGRHLAQCISGQWVDDVSSCIDDDQCVNGTRRDSDTECGFSGYLEQQCVNGVWLTQSNRCLECKRSYQVPDPLFQSSLSERNNIPADPVDPESVKYMVTLDLSFSSISDATGIQCFTSLQDLNLSKNQLSDLTPLASLTQLRSLSLAYNSLYGSSLAPLGALTELRYLSLEAAAVTSLDGLQSLTSMEELRVPYNHIQDVTPLLPMTSLASLSIYGNAYLECESAAYATLRDRVPMLYSDCP